jgi:DNA mismatch repair protein MSH5
LFYKCPLTRKLDTQLGDIYGRISDREIELNFQLHKDFAPYISNLLEICNSVAFLDCTLAFSQVSQNRNFTRPVMVSDPVLQIKQGRHPLQELWVDHFVPNSFSLDRDNRIMILTGPNCSGKSVLIKQVALIVYMAHIGCFIPCESGSVIGLTDTVTFKSLI